MDTKRLVTLSLALNILLITVLVGGGSWLFANRVEIFRNLAASYLAELQNPTAPANPEDKNAAETLITGAVERANPAVISIIVTKEVPIFRDFFGSGLEEFFGPFNFRVPIQRQEGSEKREIGGGSGFIVTPQGLAVTNRHVVADTAAEYTAITNQGEKYGVEVVATDPVLDIAVIKLKTSGKLPYLNFGDSDKLKLGQTVIAIGNALGEFSNSISVGVVSGLARSIVAGDGAGQSEFLEEVIQTDAAINPGNSGGPLLDLKGRVVGVNVAMARGSENIGFALPANLAATIVQSVERHGEIVRPFLGIRYQLITPALKEKNNLPADYGVIIRRGENKDELAVIPGSPADKAGLAENDIILEMDGVKLNDKTSLASQIRKKKVGEVVILKVLQKGKEKTVTAVLEKQKN